MITITRRLEFDAGHRIPDHYSQCRNLHGHRYVLEVTLAGAMIHAKDASENGMIMDFSHVKYLARQHLIDAWDHAFLVYEKDVIVCEFLKSLPNHKTVILEFVPTVENLVSFAFKRLKPLYKDYYNDLDLHKLVLYETPNCWSEANEQSYKE